MDAKKTLLLLVSTAILNIGVYAQSDTISLRQFTPKITTQQGPNCWAYASAYVAVSTRLAYLNKTPNPSNKQAFSYGLICSAMSLASWGKVDEWSNEMFPDCKSGIGNLDFALYSLVNYGTVSYAEFPQVSTKLTEQKLKSILSSAKKVIKIKDVHEIISTCTCNDRDKSIQTIKAALQQGKPIVCAIYQDRQNGSDGCDENFIKQYSSRMPPESNHIVNIVGISESSKKFLIKNNYEEDCTFWVDWDKVLSITSWAYTFDIDIIR